MLNLQQRLPALSYSERLAGANGAHIPAEDEDKK